jgi:hypothetical protein
MEFAIAIGGTVVLGLFYTWTSRINGLFYFGRTVSPDFHGSTEARAITRQYVLSIALATVVAALGACAAVYFGGLHFALIGILLEWSAFAVCFARANAQVRRLLRDRPDWSGEAPATREAVLVQQPKYWIPGLAAIAAPLVAVPAMTLTTILLTPHHGGPAAAFTSFTDRADALGESFVLGMSCGLIAAATAVLLLFRISVRLRTRMAQYSIRSSFAMLCIGSALLVGTLISNLAGVTMSKGFGKGLGLAGLLAAGAVMVWNQARAKRFVPPAVEMGSDDRWLGGLFYVDRADPALFVQSRCGTGYSLNYGRVAAWPISIGVVAYFIAAMFFLPHTH